MKKIKFIHAADLHLDSPLASLALIDKAWSLRLQEAVWQAYDNLIKLAVEEEVNFVIFAGDIFDDYNYYYGTQRKFITGLEKLSQAQIHSYILFGNHDYIDGITSRSNNLFDIDNPYIHIFPNDRVGTFVYEEDGQGQVALWGQSYWQSHIQDNLVHVYGQQLESDLAQSRDLAGMIKIAVLHGEMNAPANQLQYAPFKSSDLGAYPIDYWALGHVHTRQIIPGHDGQPIAIYPGNLCGRHINEGGERGAYLIEMTRQSAQGKLNIQAEFHHLAPFVWAEYDLDLTDLSAGSLADGDGEDSDTFDKVSRGPHIASSMDLELYLVDFLLEAYQREGRGLLTRVLLRGQTGLAGALLHQDLKALVEAVNESLARASGNKAVLLEIVNQTQGLVDLDKLMEEKSLLGIYLQKNLALREGTVLAADLTKDLGVISRNGIAKSISRDPAFAKILTIDEAKMVDILTRAEKKAVTMLLDTVGGK